MSVDLRNMTATEALRYARMVSGKTLEDLAEITGWGMSQVKQYFDSSARYFPSLPRIPTLCEAMGNTILLDWLKAQLEEIEPAAMIRSGCDLLMKVARVGAELGDVQRSTESALSDGRLDDTEAAALCGDLLDVEKAAKCARHGLTKLVGQRYVQGKGFRRVVVEVEE